MRELPPSGRSFEVNSDESKLVLGSIEEQGYSFLEGVYDNVPPDYDKYAIIENKTHVMQGSYVKQPSNNLIIHVDIGSNLEGILDQVMEVCGEGP